MQNKWYVGGMVLPAVALIGITAWCAATQGWLLASAPAVLAGGLLRGAWWAGHCEPFAQVSRKHVGDVGTSVAVARWQQHCADREAAAASKAAASANTPTSPPGG